jgi:hypothetical protein
MNQQLQIQKYCGRAVLVRPHPSPLPNLGEGARNYTLLSGAPSHRIGRRGWGMRAKGLKRHQLVLNLELLGMNIVSND